MQTTKSQKIDMDDEFLKKTVIRFSQTPENYLNVSAGDDV